MTTSHIKDLHLLKEVQGFFGEAGKIVIFKNYCTFRVDSLSQIVDVIIPHFDKYSPVTQKLADYMLFKDIISLMTNKEHLTLEGLRKIISIKASLNLGLSNELKTNFPTISPVVRPLIKDKEIPNPY